MTPTKVPAGELRGAGMLAGAYLRIDAARQYGLIVGGPLISVERCRDIVDAAHAAGHVWTEDELTALLRIVLSAR